MKSTRNPSRRCITSRQRSRAMMEALEERQLFSLLGVTLASTPLIAFGGPTMTYSAATGDLATNSQLTIALPSGTITPPGTLSMDIKVNNSGNLTGASSSTDVVVTDSTGTLLTGQVTGFGYQFIDAQDAAFDFTFHVTGGSLQSQFANSDIGIVIQADISTFTGSFASDFNTDVKGTLGPIPPQGGSKPAAISGTKFEDLTGNGFSADDVPLAGITVNLYQNSTLVTSTITDAQGNYAFTNLTPGTYFVQEVVPTGWIETGGLGGYTIVAGSGTVSTGNNFDNFNDNGVYAGEFATIGFWHNKNGQAVINALNGGSTHTELGNWLATNFPHLFGQGNVYDNAGLSSLPGHPTTFAGLTNAQVANVYLNLWNPSGVAKNTYVQAFAVALGLYADTSALGGASLVSSGLASKFGFAVTTGGAGVFNVGSNGAAFGVANNTSLSVYNILQIADANFNATTGLFYGGNAIKTGDLNNVLNGINTKGDIV